MITSAHPGGVTMLLCICSGLLLAAGIQAAPLPFEAEYRIVSKNLGVEVGRIERRLERIGDHYAYRSVSRATGLADLVTRDRRTEQSVIEHTADGWRALFYTYRRDSRKKKHQRTATFDWNNARLLLSTTGGRRALELSPHTTDRLGSELVLMQNLRRDSIEGVYRITNGNTVNDYRFDILQRNATVQTPLGAFSGVQLRRRRVSGGDTRETLLWCIPELGYLPVRIEGNVDAFVAELVYYRDEERELGTVRPRD